MNNKLKIKILIAFSIVLLVILGFLSFIYLKKSNQQPSVTNIVQDITQNNPFIETPRISINDIKIKDVTQNPIEKNSQNDVVFIENKDYQILLFHDNTFLISILSSPFDKVRQVAETKFLERLGITKDEACKLDVSITTPYSANPNESGNIYKLSFCK